VLAVDTFRATTALAPRVAEPAGRNPPDRRFRLAASVLHLYGQTTALDDLRSHDAPTGRLPLTSGNAGV
jgi:hypothetical protein